MTNDEIFMRTYTAALTGFLAMRLGYDVAHAQARNVAMLAVQDGIPVRHMESVKG